MNPTSLLAALWLIAPLVAIGIPSMLFARGTLGPDTFARAMSDLSQAFVPYSGVVLAFVYRERYLSGQAPRATRALRRLGLPAAVALVASVTWNLVVLMPMVQAGIGALAIETALKTATELSDSLAWAVAPALGNFFALNHSRVETVTQQRSAS